MRAICDVNENSAGVLRIIKVRYADGKSERRKNVYGGGKIVAAAKGKAVFGGRRGNVAAF